jgi:hypothetical protein
MAGAARFGKAAGEERILAGKAGNVLDSPCPGGGEVLAVFVGGVAGTGDGLPGEVGQRGPFVQISGGGFRGDGGEELAEGVFRFVGFLADEKVSGRQYSL